MAKKKSLLWHLFFSYLVITLLSLVAVTWYSTASVKKFMLETDRGGSGRESALVWAHASAAFEPP